jgi:hypothetical protein
MYIQRKIGGELLAWKKSSSRKPFKLIFDTGIYQRILGLDVASLLLKNDVEVVNKGSIAELFVGLEFMKSNDAYERTGLYYWHREAKNSQAELDYVVQKQDRIVPIVRVIPLYAASNIYSLQDSAD